MLKPSLVSEHNKNNQNVVWVIADKVCGELM